MDYSTSLTITVTMDADHQMRAWYMCPASMAAASTTDPLGTVALLHRFRDEVLAKTEIGQGYTRMFYQYAPEVGLIMLRYPALLSQAANLLERYKSAIETMVNHSPVTVGQTDLQNVNGLLNSFSSASSPSLRAAIQQLKRDLVSTQIQTQFGITVSR